MAYDREPRSASPDNSRSPGRGHRRRSRSLSKSRKSRSRSRETEEVLNPGNNLYVTGLSTRVSSGALENFFSKEGKVIECQLVTDPHTKESRGFGFVTMETNEDAERCIKHLNRAVLEGRMVTVEKRAVCPKYISSVGHGVCWRKGSVGEHPLLENTRAREINEMKDRIYEEGLVATHLEGVLKEILILWIDEDEMDHVIPMVVVIEGQMIIPVRIEDVVRID